MTTTAHGGIQWKGTDVCMDVYCKCGNHFHIDGYFCNYVKCPKCGTVYECSNKIELTETLTVYFEPLTEAND